MSISQRLGQGPLTQCRFWSFWGFFFYPVVIIYIVLGKKRSRFKTLKSGEKAVLHFCGQQFSCDWFSLKLNDSDVMNLIAVIRAWTSESRSLLDQSTWSSVGRSICIHIQQVIFSVLGMYNSSDQYKRTNKYKKSTRQSTHVERKINISKENKYVLRHFVKRLH